MRFNSNSASRLQLYDRNGKMNGAGTVIAGAAPTALTTVASGSPSNNRIWVVAGIHLRLKRATVATTAGQAQMQATLTPQSVAEFPIGQLEVLTNNIGDNDRADFGGSLRVGTGDLVKLKYADLSTAGTFDYSASIYATEGDL